MGLRAYFGAVLGVAVLLVVAGTLVLSTVNLHMERLGTTGRLTSAIGRDAARLLSAANDLDGDAHQRALEQWRAQHERIGEQILALGAQGDLLALADARVTDLSGYHGELAHLIGLFGATAAGKAGDGLRDRLLLDRMVIGSQRLSDAAFEINEAIDVLLVGDRIRVRNYGYGFAALMLALMAWMALSAYRRALAPLGTLQRVADRIAAGERSLRMRWRRDDELGHLADAFDRMLDAVEASEARFAIVFESSPDPIVVQDEGVIEMANAAALSVRGATRREQVVGHHVNEFLHPDSQAHAASRHTWIRAQPGRTVAPRTMRICRLDGQSIEIESVATSFASEGRVKIVTISRDITERERIRRLLEQDAGRFQQAFAQRMVGIAITSPQRQVIEVNDACCELIGRSRGELLRMSWIDFTHPDDVAGNLQLLTDTLEGRTEGYRLQKRFIHRDGRILHADIVARAVRAADGKVDYLVLLVQDITAQKVAEAALREHAEELARSNRELEQFAYIASHDLQEPLRMVTSFTRLLQKRYQGRLDAEADEFIEFAVDGATRMQALIRGLLEFSRVGRGKGEWKPVCTRAVFDEALANLRAAVEESGATVHLPDGDPPALHGDHGRLVQLFQNLIGNALKFRGLRSPCVTVDWTLQAGTCRFAVSDNGIGIAPEHHDRIFGLFKRLHDRSRYPGAGIGLALCRRIVEAHGGSIEVESHPGSGTCFRVALPLSGAPEAGAPEAPRRTPEAAPA